MRNFFIDKLVKNTKKNNKNFLIVGDLGYNVVESFAKKFPKNFLNVGVAEQNMAGLAAGIASEGFSVFIYSIANFPTFRCAEQIRNDIDYHNLSVNVISVGSGFSYGNLGYSHHAIQDYGLIRMFPNFTIHSPGDLSELNGCLEYIFASNHPNYLRLDKSKYNQSDYKKINLKPKKLIKKFSYKKNNNKTILMTGACQNLLNKLKIIDEFKNYDINSLPIWGSKYKKKLNKFFEKYKRVVTLEDHILDSGFGTWTLESNLNLKKSKIDCIAYDNLNIKVAGNKLYLENLSLKNNYYYKKIKN